MLVAAASDHGDAVVDKLEKSNMTLNQQDYFTEIITQLYQAKTTDSCTLTVSAFPSCHC